MKTLYWSKFHEFLQDFQELWTAIANPQKGQSFEDRCELSCAVISKDDFVMLRTELRNKLDLFKSFLNEHLNERETFLVLFPLVVYIDEKVQSQLPFQRQTDWPPLQKELYDTFNGGEQFYDTIDDILRKADTHPFLFEVFYFCLSLGFKGKYGSTPKRIEEYKEALRSKISLPEVERDLINEDDEGFLTIEKPSYWPYYAAVAVFLFGIYTSLYVVSAVAR